MQFFYNSQNTNRFTPRLIVADLMGQNLRRILVKRAMAGLLLLAAVNIYVIGHVGVSTFPTALNGTTVYYAPNAISLPAETQNTTHLGRRLEVCGHLTCYMIEPLP